MSSGYPGHRRQIHHRPVATAARTPAIFFLAAAVAPYFLNLRSPKSSIPKALRPVPADVSAGSGCGSRHPFLAVFQKSCVSSFPVWPSGTTTIGTRNGRSQSHLQFTATMNHKKSQRNPFLDSRPGYSEVQCASAVHVVIVGREQASRGLL